ncbi:DinB family protein [Persicitalea sp.]|uniref:DinB family protein n=1 Tax=Persicitalea sp. TaxID=3100273 RepID=UPI0035939F90
MTQLHATTREIIAQLQILLNHLEKASYSDSLPILQGSSIGQHLRHVIEFYICLSRQIDGGTVNYDDRERNHRLENDLIYTRQILGELSKGVANWHTDQPLQLRAIYGDTDGALVPTSLARELVYLIEHAVHHMAIVKMAVSHHLPHIVLPGSFGVAYSTRQHRETACAS